jgi:hypothetical protein
MPILDVKLTPKLPCRGLTSYPALDEEIYYYNEMRKQAASCGIGADDKYVAKEFAQYHPFPNGNSSISLYDLQYENQVIQTLESQMVSVPGAADAYFFDNDIKKDIKLKVYTKPITHWKLECIDRFDEAWNALENSIIDLPNLNDFFKAMIFMGWFFAAISCFFPCFTCYKLGTNNFNGMSIAMVLTVAANFIFNLVVLIRCVDMRVQIAQNLVEAENSQNGFRWINDCLDSDSQIIRVLTIGEQQAEVQGA